MPPVSSSRRATRGEREVRAVQRAAHVLDRPTTTATLRQRLDDLAVAAGGADLDSSVDVYGDGVVTDLERRVADLLGTEDAAFFPSGTTAQQVALRCWAARDGRGDGPGDGRGDERGDGRGTVALHALSHLLVHESDALPRLAGLRTVPVTTAPRPTTADDVRGVAEPFGTLVLELPLRDAGYLLPTWEELVDVTAAARDRGAAVHVDGARLWETTDHFGRPLDQIAALADSVYVSFYKSLRGLSGAALAGPAAFVEHARLERHRYGGNIFQQFPAALTALHGLDQELPRLPAQVARARVVAHALAGELTAAGVPWFAVHPATPHTHQFQLWLPHPADVLTEAATRQAERTGTALLTHPWREPGLPPGLSRTEITVGRAGLEWDADDVRAAVREFLTDLAAVLAERRDGGAAEA
ncbi:threonine aldolase family protein [Kineococcus radiotolerans]|uniref:threonine aldolase family protein n=1 Tax=Kineococcus radiotolerans TaxID=131568 RepID=UPI00160F7E9A|nr:beta-eliminating lyase-related protein [Kineococcus radiotolerans]